MKILILDDNAHHAELASHRLAEEGWEVTTTDVPEPQADWSRFDFILLDYSMPRRTGLEVFKLMKDLQLQTPVIFMTGHGNEGIATEAIKRGAYDYIVKDTKLLYLDQLPTIIREARAKHELIETNRFLIQELRRANERLQKMTFTDEMTGIYNYRFIQKQIDTEVQRALRYEKTLSICLIDIDRFKSINDEFGHPTGDLVLKELSKILRETTRTVDFVGRYAGDEFIIIFPDTLLTDATKLCERIRRNVVENLVVPSEKGVVRVSISIGITDFDSKRRKSSEALIESADKCLYEAKQSGRDRVCTLASFEKRSETFKRDSTSISQAVS